MSTAPNPVPAPVRPYRSRSIFGPLVLICIGLLFLAKNVGWISSHTLFWWFSRWWPAILILWGLIKVLEYAMASRKGEPAPRGIGAGGVVFLIFFILFGLSATGASHINWDNLKNSGNWGDGDWNWFDNHYDFTENSSQPMADAAQIKVLCASGDVNVNPSPDNQAHIYVHKRLSGDSQTAANHQNDLTHPKFEQQGKVWVMDLTGGNFEHGRFNLDLQLPPNAALSITTGRGDITVSQRVGDVDLNTDRGSINAKSIKGNAMFRLHHGDVTAEDITGNVQINGSGGDTNVSNVSGTLTVNGEYQGDSRYSHVGGQVQFKSNRTDLQFAKLDGDFSMDSGDLRADSITGPFRLETRSKSVHLENVTGDIHIDDTNAGVEVTSKLPLGNVDISSARGGIEVTIPSSAGFQVDAESKNGEILSPDFSLTIDNSHRDVVAHGTIGKGGPMVRLRSERGTIQIKKMN
jgi:DUF4097 and DUF4098 domain-containing protein YvlB